VYFQDDPLYFYEALQSIIRQTLQPAQVVIVVDGKIPKALQKVMDNFYDECQSLGIVCDMIYLPRNTGHGIARRISIENARYKLVALMDADDIARRDRFYKQINIFGSNSSVSVVGGQIVEIDHRTKEEKGKRIVPQNDKEIKEYMKSRCPFNQMTVMFKKEDVMKAGNYRDFFHNEDYDLWIRMYLQGFSFYNVSDILVDVRVNESFYKRRGGWRYFISEYKIQHIMYKNGMISYPRYILNISIRFILQVMLTDTLRGYVFKKLARERNKDG
jgi:glycosyltransferase involved in cell wall biosynthesis